MSKKYSFRYSLLLGVLILPLQSAEGLVINGEQNEINLNASSADTQIIISEDGSITNQNSSSYANYSNNGITIESDAIGASIQNKGKIKILTLAYNIHDTSRILDFGNGINDINQSHSISNAGTITTNITLSGDTSNSYGTSHIYLEGSASGVYGNLSEHTGKITTFVELTGGKANISSTTDSITATGYADMHASANGVDGYVEKNSGIIQTKAILKGGEAKSTTSAAASTATASAYASAEFSINGIFINNNKKMKNNSGDIKVSLTTNSGKSTTYNSYKETSTTTSQISNTANGIYGSLGSNKGRLKVQVTLNAGETLGENGNASAMYARARANQSANGIYGNLDTNTGIIDTDVSIKAGSIHAQLVQEISAYAYGENAANGVDGHVKSNKGLIKTRLNMAGGQVVASSGSSVTTIYIDRSGNGIFGSLDSNKGTIASYLTTTKGSSIIGGGSADIGSITAAYSNNAIAFDSPDTQTKSQNTGSILSSQIAISVKGTSSNLSFDNKGVLAAKRIYSSSNIASTNQGLYVILDDAGNVTDLEYGDAGLSNDGRIIENTTQSDTDSFKIYTSENSIIDKIINGVGIKNGVATLNNTQDFTIKNSSLNAYHTALEIKTNKKITATNSYFNGGGLKGEIPVIKGDSQSNHLSVLGNSFINGASDFGWGNDTLIFDTKNGQLNGIVDFNNGEDSFIQYSYEGNEQGLIDYLTYDGQEEKIKNVENLGLEKGSLNILNNFTNYGLYIGSQAYANFTTKTNYNLKNLKSYGTVNLNNNRQTNLNIAGDTLLNNRINFDADFDNLTADKITVQGNLSGNGDIGINNNPTNKSDNKGQLSLIKAPNDNNRKDEKFTIAPPNRYNGQSNMGRFTGSIYVWELKPEGNNWLLQTTSDLINPPPKPDPIPKPKPDPDPIPQPKTEILAEIPAYTSLPTLGRKMAFSELNSLHNRLGELRRYQGVTANRKIRFDKNTLAGWLKPSGGYFSADADKSFDVSGSYGGVSMGADKQFSFNNNSWFLFAGVFGGYQTGRFETLAQSHDEYFSQEAQINMDTWSIGAYASFFNISGTYIDIVGEYMGLTANIDAAQLKVKTTGYALSASVEAGHRFDFKRGWAIEPQAQLKAAYINWEDFNDGINDIRFENQIYALARSGVRIEKNIKIKYGELTPWFYLGMQYELSDTPQVSYANTSFAAHNFGLSGEAKAGITTQFSNMQLYGSVGYIGNSSHNNIQASIGLRINW
ncbi:MAG: autotransporter domain-containing protein [Alphaproteobacteria bacterium]